MDDEHPSSHHTGHTGIVPSPKSRTNASHRNGAQKKAHPADANRGKNRAASDRELKPAMVIPLGDDEMGDF